jgi:hypothetical protein
MEELDSNSTMNHLIFQNPDETDSSTALMKVIEIDQSPAQRLKK